MNILIFLIILLILASYIIIQMAIDKSINTKLLKENTKLLVEIRDLLKEQNEKKYVD
ncbi:hypothetical protein CLSAP_21900 [Clostridium saccharoperbutylacetonicum]|nr:hypothetical protein CLSAP_21900 [Clostridium saccharoperbutylacetonicum]NSB30717.1 large-conductance mechanosensitive channel [Clostridium saccharoperbutylacetonicum]